MQTRQHFQHLQVGLTLIELMVALAIFSILMLGVGNVFTANKRNYAIQDELARMQESARFAFTTMTQDLRGAGYTGCNPDINVLLDQADPSYSPALFDFTVGVGGWEFLGTGSPSATAQPGAFTAGGGGAANFADSGGGGLANVLIGLPIENSDVLTVKGAAPVSGLNPTGNTPPNAATITLNQASGIDAGTIIILSDCQKANVFQNTNNSAAVSVARGAGAAGISPGNVPPGGNPLSQAYGANAQILTATANSYFVGLNPAGQPALFQFDLSQGTGAGRVPLEIAEGVESLQLLYGEDTTAVGVADDDVLLPNRYVTIDNVVAPINIRSVKISLLMRTINPLPKLTPAANTFDLFGWVGGGNQTSITNAVDSRVRRVFTTTVFLRNQAVPDRKAWDGT